MVVVLFSTAVLLVGVEASIVVVVIVLGSFVLA